MNVVMYKYVMYKYRLYKYENVVKYVCHYICYYKIDCDDSWKMATLTSLYI